MSENGKRGPSFLARLFKKEEPLPTSLEAEPDGFAYVADKGRTSVKWSTVKEVFAFKRDVFSYDLICIGFRISDEGAFWEIDERMSGYEEVLAAMKTAFPDMASEWWGKVAMPPFTMNLLTLWGQPKMGDIWRLGPKHRAGSQGC